MGFGKCAVCAEPVVAGDTYVTIVATRTGDGHAVGCIYHGRCFASVDWKSSLARAASSIGEG